MESQARNTYDHDMNNMKLTQHWHDYISLPEQEWSLMEMAFLMAGQLQTKVDLSSSRQSLEQFKYTLSEQLSNISSSTEKIETINRYLYGELGFSANQDDYFNPENSLIDQVITNRKGIPITLSLIYMEMLAVAGIECSGINFPGHFLVGAKVSGHFHIHDAFRQGNVLDRKDIKKMLLNHQIGINNDDELATYLQPASNRQIIVRLLRNLKNIYIEQQDAEMSLLVIDMILALIPFSSEEIRDRGMVYHYLEYIEGALLDLNSYLELEPDSADRAIIEALIESLQDQSTPIH